jgi:hypothetical protein
MPTLSIGRSIGMAGNCYFSHEGDPNYKMTIEMASLTSSQPLPHGRCDELRLVTQQADGWFGPRKKSAQISKYRDTI